MSQQKTFLPRSPIGLCQFPGFSSPETRVDEDAVLSDSAHSGGAAADAVVPVALHQAWVRLDSEALVRWSSEIRWDLVWWWDHERLELVSLLERVSPQLDLRSDSSDVGWALVSILFRGS